jgi:transcription elongation factor GreA
VKRVAAARELGDLRENAEYQTSRQELGFIDGRIQQLEGRLRNAVVVEDSTTAAAGLGSTVVVEAGETTVEYRLVDSSEANLAAGRLSTSSPVGRALLGRTAGDDVVVTTPGGPQTFRIVEVR